MTRTRELYRTPDCFEGLWNSVCDRTPELASIEAEARKFKDRLAAFRLLKNDERLTLENYPEAQEVVTKNFKELTDAFNSLKAAVDTVSQYGLDDAAK